MSAATLFLPFAPVLAAEASSPSLPCPALERLLAKASVSSHACAESAQWACEAFGVSRQQDWPVAPLALRGAGLDPGGHYWLCATPVHLQVQRDRMILMPSHLLAIAPDESAALVATLESHFSRDGLEFRAPTPESWYLRCTRMPDLQTTSPELATGRHVDPLLPSGRDGLDFHRLINEAQMLLHEHPVNIRREALDVPPINSLWLWGGGTLPASARSPWPRVGSSRLLERGLAALAAVPAAMADGNSASGGLCVLSNQPGNGPAEADVIERAWAAPMLERLAKGSLDRLDVVVQGSGSVKQWTLRRPDLWKFWRRPRPLDALLGEALA